MMKSVISTDRVELRTTLASDLFYALFGAAMSAVVVGVFVQAGGNILALGHDAGAVGKRFGPLLTTVLILGGIPLFGMWMVGGWLRLFDRAPAITATTTGLSFHPAFGPRSVPWKAVETLRLADRQIAIRLRTRIWSPWVWLSGRTISPYFKELGLSEAKACDAIAAMQALQARMSRPEASDRTAATA
jgi:hypothetical protein